MYEVFGGVASRAFRVLWLLDEMGIEFTHHDLKAGSDAMKAVNPSGKVPAIKVDGELITDSSAIMTYLADKHGQFTYPAGTLERAKQDAWFHQIIDEIDAVLWAAARHSFVLPEEQRVPAVKDSLKWEFARNIKRISERMEGPYLQGETMTIADILLVHCLGWAISAKFDTQDAAIDAYASRLRKREGFRKARGRLTA